MAHFGVGVGEHFAEDFDEFAQLVGRDDVARAQERLQAHQSLLPLRPVRTRTRCDDVVDVFPGL